MKGDFSQTGEPLALRDVIFDKYLNLNGQQKCTLCFYHFVRESFLRSVLALGSGSLWNNSG